MARAQGPDYTVNKDEALIAFYTRKVRAFANAHPEEYFNESIRARPGMTASELDTLHKQAPHPAHLLAAAAARYFSILSR